MTIELLPTRSRYAAGKPVTIEIVGTVPEHAVLDVHHLGIRVGSVQAATLTELGTLPAGGYGVKLRAPDGTHARTAVEVCEAGVPARVLRYGFVTDYRPERDLAGVADNVRRLHLTHIQFYDWAYRHADLLGGGDEYRDALDQPIDLNTVRRMITTLAQAGTHSLGYAAVYGVGNDEWPQWSYAALLTPADKPYSLGDFLQLVDPADEKWLAHFTAELATAADQLGFHGFHLDQYGYPKIATTPTDQVVILEDSFAAVIEAARAAVPDAELVFNNVNDFPTWRTAHCAQDAVYIEVWPPHVTLSHLADLVTRTHAVSSDKPIVVAAYQHVYDRVDAESVDTADLATAFTMATLFSHGATQLLCGEADRILVDPYYVRNQVASASTRAMLARWYDFAVEHGELLFGASTQINLTGALAGRYNDDCDVRFDSLEVTETPTAGAIWRRVTAGPRPGQLVVHLINLVDQEDVLWDAPRAAVRTRPIGSLRLRRVGTSVLSVSAADPETTGTLVELTASARPDDWVEIELPALGVWQVVLIDLTPDAVSTTTSPSTTMRSS